MIFDGSMRDVCLVCPHSLVCTANGWVPESIHLSIETDDVPDTAKGVVYSLGTRYHMSCVIHGSGPFQFYLSHEEVYGKEANIVRHEELITRKEADLQ